MQYAFDEAGLEKSAVVFDLNEDGVHDLKEVRLRSGRQLVRLQARGVAEAEELLKRYENCYIELTVYLNEPLSSRQVRSLKEANDGLLNIIPEIAGETYAVSNASRKQLSPLELFTEFYRSRFGEDAPDALKELFMSVTEEAHEA